MKRMEDALLEIHEYGNNDRAASDIIKGELRQKERAASVPPYDSIEILSNKSDSVQKKVYLLSLCSFSLILDFIFPAFHHQHCNYSLIYHQPF